MPLVPRETTPNPTTAPTIECVVETGHDIHVAINNQVPAANSAAIMPHAKMYGACSGEYWFAISIGSKMPLRTVFETLDPTMYAPANSKIAAKTTAHFRVRAPEPTEVPIALATSLAPMFQAT